MTENEVNISEYVRQMREEVKRYSEDIMFVSKELWLQIADLLENENEEIQQYRAIGMVEEFKELKEKNTPKKPFGGMYDWTCPTCGTYHSTHGKCCSECMQVILWD